MTKSEVQSLSERELWTLKEFVENTLRKSGTLLLEMYGKGDKQLKFDDELVTEADNAAWKIIFGKIQGSFEGHGFLRELSQGDISGENCPRFLWIVDTLDGAASFQAGMPVWGVSAALFELFWPVLGFLYLPVTGELYSAYAGREALLNDKPIRVREDPTVDNESLVLVYSRFHQDFVSDFPGKIRNFGSSAGTNPMKEPVYRLFEYWPATAFCAVPVWPATSYPWTAALVAVPHSFVTNFNASVMS